MSNFSDEDSFELGGVVTTFHHSAISPWQTNSRQPTLTFNPEDWIPDNFYYSEDENRYPYLPDTFESDLQDEGPRLLDRIMSLEEEQNEIQEQIRNLNRAHEELEHAREELLHALAQIDDQLEDEHIYLQEDQPPIRLLPMSFNEEEMLYENQNENNESSCDEDDNNSTVGLGLMDAFSHTLNLGARTSVGGAVVFLDQNGEECNGLFSTMRNAVGWVSAKTRMTCEVFSMDENGNEMYLDSNFGQKSESNR